MYKENEREDLLDDDIGAIIAKLLNRTTWTAEVERNRTELCKLLVKRQYIYFRGHPYRYGLTTMTMVFLTMLQKELDIQMDRCLLMDLLLFQ